MAIVSHDPLETTNKKAKRRNADPDLHTPVMGEGKPWETIDGRLREAKAHCELWTGHLRPSSPDRGTPQETRFWDIMKFHRKPGLGFWINFRT